MASTNKTPRLGLSQWVLSDPFRMEDFNQDNAKLDALVGAMPIFRLGQIVTSTNADRIDIDLSDIDWNRYGTIRIISSIRHNGQTDTFYTLNVTVNGRSNAGDYCTRLLNTNASSPWNTSSGIGSCNIINYTDHPNHHRFSTEIFGEDGCVFITQHAGISDTHEPRGSILCASSGSNVPAPVSSLKTLNYTWTTSASGASMQFLAGCKFTIYGVLK